MVKATLLYLKNSSPAFGCLSPELTECPMDLAQRPGAGEHGGEARELRGVKCTPVPPEITARPVSPVSHRRRIKAARLQGCSNSQHVFSGLKKFHGPRSIHCLRGDWETMAEKPTSAGGRATCPRPCLSGGLRPLESLLLGASILNWDVQFLGERPSNYFTEIQYWQYY